MPETGTNFALVSPHAGMFDAWFGLYAEYARERGAASGRKTAGVLWRWLLDGTYRVAGVIAIDPRKEVAGFVHYRPYPNTLTGTEACRIDDVFVATAHRESDLLARLIENVCATARKRGWSEVTWVAAGNPSDMPVYDQLATRHDTATYVIDL